MRPTRIILLAALLAALMAAMLLLAVCRDAVLVSSFKPSDLVAASSELLDAPSAI